MSFAYEPDWLQEDHAWVRYQGQLYHVDSYYITGVYNDDWVELNLSHASIPGLTVKGVKLGEVEYNET